MYKFLLILLFSTSVYWYFSLLSRGIVRIGGGGMDKWNDGDGDCLALVQVDLYMYKNSFFRTITVISDHTDQLKSLDH